MAKTELKEVVHNLDKGLDSRVRMGIMAGLISCDQLEFTVLRDLLGLTDGNLASHIKALLALEYIGVRKQFIDNKPNTSYFLTLKGQDAFDRHSSAMKKLLATAK